MVRGIEGLTEEERKALRGSKFAPLPPPRSQPSSSCSSYFSQSRVAHPGGPVTTNKAVALAKFLERKLQEPGGLDSMRPELVELAIKNAKETVKASETSMSQQTVQHVTCFYDEDSSSRDELSDKPKKKKLKTDKKENKNKKKKKNKMKLKAMDF